MRVAHNVVSEFASAVSQLGHGERGAFICSWAAKHGVSRDTAYRYLKKHGVTQSKKRRSDAGKRSLTKEQLKTIAAMKEASRRKTGTVLMPTTVAREIALENNLIPEVSDGYLNALLRENNLSTKTLSKSKLGGRIPQTHLSRRSGFPTQWYMADASVCVQYKFGTRGKLQFEPATRFYGKDVESYRSKRRIILRLGIIDHFTSNFYIHYYHTPGENADTWVDFLIRSFLPKDNPTMFPMLGVPHNLYTDRGSGISRAAKTKNFLRGLGVRVADPHLPGNPRAKGGSETIQRVWQSQFESRLSIQPVGSIEELNFLKDQFLVKYHHEKRMQGRNYQTRAQLWSQGVALIPEGQHYILPEDNLDAIRALAHIQPVKRTVTTHNTISLKLPSDERTRDYRLSVSGIQGERVEVYPHAFRPDTLLVLWKDEKYEAYAIEQDRHGFPSDAADLGEYRRAKDSAADIALKSVTATSLKGIDPFAGAENQPSVASIAGRTKKTTIGLPEDNPVVTADAARLHLRSALGPYRYRELLSEIDSALAGGSLRRAELEALSKRLASRVLKKHA